MNINPVIMRVQSIFSNYYLLLEEWIDGKQADSLKEAKLNIENQLNSFWRIPQFMGAKDREEYFHNIQEYLREQGYYLDITPQYGIETGSLNLQTVDNVSLRPILQQTERIIKSGEQEIPYTEFLLGDNLINVPDFIAGIVESASSSETTIFPFDLRRTLEDDYEIFQEYEIEAKKRFQPGVFTPNNLFCVQIKLHEKQWGRIAPGDASQELLVSHFRLHGEQHVADFQLINAGKLKLTVEDSGVDENLNKDFILETRVLVRQLLNKSLPFFVLEQIINFQREWLDGSRSEYALAGHLLFTKLADQKEIGSHAEIDSKLWVAGIERLSEDDIRLLAVRFAYNNKNFFDMLTEKQILEAKEIYGN